ncbi:uncharacterized protein PgNI_09358 [Pyricularia grisea]|uniref:GH16 domain-containing protein n=1 Tax=Pyricularia grisea TaxID=148305 RepID=A0A6P8ARC4_PYRGI|nr:uncharacterized protein PgNI_09358 [Pyricularia grisea]TLD04681.1 hypothetical protein PgNI_09358 [Pyricularia grisea]
MFNSVPYFLILTSGVGIALMPQVMAVSTIIPYTSFDNQTSFDAVWNYNYPWGTDHNGAARMNGSDAIRLASRGDHTLVITARRAYNQTSATHGGKQIPIKYLSGAIHAKERFTVQPNGGYDFKGFFKATTTKGTWPAFWLTAVDSWPPEIDMAEWKGSGKISFNTFNTSSEVASTNVNYSETARFHSIKCELRDEGPNVRANFYMNGNLTATQVGKGYVGKAMYLIINLQMEGSSGSPGPQNNTEYAIRGLEVLSYNP